MAKKKKPKHEPEPEVRPAGGGRHTTARRSVQFPEDWVEYAEAMAEAKPMPLVWWIIQAISEKAKRDGAAHPEPAFPWLKGGKE